MSDGKNKVLKPSATHWGAFSAEVEDGRVTGVRPFERDPESVRDDVIDGYVSRAAALADYGVALTDELEIDWNETKRLRA